MATTILVAFPVDAARLLIQRLEEAGVPVSAAFWEFDTEIEQWQFVVATPTVAEKGTLYVVRLIHRLLDEMTEEERDEMNLQQVSVRSTQQLKIREMRARHGTVTTERKPFSKWEIQSRSEPYIYRLLPA